MKALVAALLVLTFSGCAGSVFRPGTVIPNEYANDPRLLVLAEDLRPAMERVAAAERYGRFCIWGGRCRPILPRIVVEESSEGGGASYSGWANLFRLSPGLLDTDHWARRWLLAHEFGHWVLGHLILPPQGFNRTGSFCYQQRLACEIAANTESVRILELGWGVPHADAVEEAYRALLGVYLSRHVGLPGHDPVAEIRAFREEFWCGDTTFRTCKGEAVPIEESWGAS